MTTVLAANYFGDNLPQGQAGPLGLVVVLLLFVACWFLYRSMSKHMRRIPTTFDKPDPNSGDVVDPTDRDASDSATAVHREGEAGPVEHRRD